MLPSRTQILEPLENLASKPWPSGGNMLQSPLDHKGREVQLPFTTIS